MRLQHLHFFYQSLRLIGKGYRNSPINGGIYTQQLAICENL